MTLFLLILNIVCVILNMLCTITSYPKGNITTGTLWLIATIIWTATTCFNLQTYIINKR